LDFKPTLATHNQIKSVTVCGWNRRSKKQISAKSLVTDAKFRMNQDIQRLITQCHPREEIVVHEPVFTPQQAQQRADAILTDRLRGFVKATGTTVGLADLRAGVNVQIGGLGSRFSGTYFVTGTTHTIGGNGYTTRFTARREDFDGGSAS
jgi:phage protein D